MDQVHAAWLAGLIEGEGNFYGNDNTPTVTIKMTDRDIIERAATLMGSTVRPCSPPSNGHKQQWATTACGLRAAKVLTAIRPWMGWRRKAELDAVADKFVDRKQGSHWVSSQAVLLVRGLYEKGVSRKHLADICDVSPETIANITSGRTRGSVVQQDYIRTQG